MNDYGDLRPYSKANLNWSFFLIEILPVNYNVETWWGLNLSPIGLLSTLSWTLWSDKKLDARCLWLYGFSLLKLKANRSNTLPFFSLWIILPILGYKPWTVCWIALITKWKIVSLRHLACKLVQNEACIFVRTLLRDCIYFLIISSVFELHT